MQNVSISGFTSLDDGILGSIVVILKLVDSEESVFNGTGTSTRRLLYNILAENAPTSAHRMHESSNLKPFTVSKLFTHSTQKTGPEPEDGQQLYMVRFTTLDAGVYKASMRGLLDRYRNSGEVEIGIHRFEIERLVAAGISERYASLSSYRSIWQQQPRKKFRFRFMSPTGFRMGSGVLALPLPYSVYRGLWRKWNQFAPSDLQIDEGILQMVREHVFPFYHDIRTVMLERKDHGLLGFVGRCGFEVIGEIPEEMLRKLTVLTEYAYYAGVGMKTTQGMGQTLIENRQ